MPFIESPCGGHNTLGGWPTFFCFLELFIKVAAPPFVIFERWEAQAPRFHRIEFLLYWELESRLSGARLWSVPPTLENRDGACPELRRRVGQRRSWYFFRTAEERWALARLGMKKKKMLRHGSSGKGPGLPTIIPPRSTFRLVRSDAKTPGWKADIGRVFRIGYYSRQDGLYVIWLANEKGDYEQTTDRNFLVKYFQPVAISDETDVYGPGKPEFPPLRNSAP